MLLYDKIQGQSEMGCQEKRCILGLLLTNQCMWAPCLMLLRREPAGVGQGRARVGKIHVSLLHLIEQTGTQTFLWCLIESRLDFIGYDDFFWSCSKWLSKQSLLPIWVLKGKSHSSGGGNLLKIFNFLFSLDSSVSWEQGMLSAVSPFSCRAW